MSSTIDVVANTNPAFCSLLLYSFVDGYAEAAGMGPELPLAFIAVPIVASRGVSTSFQGTNKNTGLLEWLTRVPELQIHIGDEIREALPISRHALLFGLQQRCLELINDRVLTRADALKRAPRDAAGAEDEQRMFSLARRFGVWCGGVNNTAIIFTALGIRP
jgi:hypothetical protein